MMKVWRRRGSVLLLIVALVTAAIPVGTQQTLVQAKTMALTKQMPSRALQPTGDLSYKTLRYTKESAEAVECTQVKSTATKRRRGTVQNLQFASASCEDQYGYDQLTSAQKLLYADACSAFETYVSSSTYQTVDYTTSSSNYDADNDVYMAFAMAKSFEDYGLTTTQGLQVYFTIRHNNPQYYWIDTAFYPTAKRLIVLINDYYVKAADRKAAESRISKGIDQYVQVAEKCSTTYEKVRTVHDMLIDNVEYAYKSGTTPETAIWAHNLDGAFSNNYQNGPGVVCEGYAKTFELVLNELGIDNVYIVGTASGGGHAWNAVKLDDGKYYYVDATWDDATKGNNDGRKYTYFCVPKTYFQKTHTAYKSTSTAIAKWLYALPANLADTMEGTYYTRYESYLTGITSTDEAKNVIRKAAAATPSTYLHLLCDTSSTNYVCWALGVSSYQSYSGLGNVVIALPGEYGITSPATSISLNKSTAAVDRGVSNQLTLTASLSAGSDDVVQWSVTGTNSLSAATGKQTTITFMQNGTFTVTATALQGKVSAKCTVTVTKGDQVNGADVVLWANGKTYVKKEQLTTTLKATTWVNAKGKTQKGKLGWIVLNDGNADLQFNTQKHTLLTKAGKEDRAMATITAAGLVTLKEPGTVYAYAYDTGSCQASDPIEISVSRQDMQKKSYTLVPDIAATTWYNAKGKAQKGKLLWVAKAQKTNISFDHTKHTLLTKADKTDRAVGTVSAKGLVTAKGAGKLYVYACDTGSMTAEEFVVEVKNAPSGIKFSTVAGSIDKTAIQKKLYVTVDGTGSVSDTDTAYVIGTIGNKLSQPIDEDTTYSVTIPEKYQDYLTATVVKDSSGAYVLMVKAKSNATTQALKKQASVSIKVTCDQSVRTASISVAVLPKA
ncbi:MAG: transglutaminase domain-containing protein [Eubacteriales bacterium]|nr:transglutaminase domain-containing protein [Eubacteriales bacterium]